MKSILRFALSAALVGLILWWAGVGDTLDRLAEASLAGAAAVIALHVVDRLLMAYKWWRLLRVRDYAVALGDAIRSYFLASFVGAVLPVAGGADAARVAAMRGKGASTESLIASVALERTLGAIAHGLYCLVAVGLLVALQIQLDVSASTLGLAAAALVALLILALPLSFRLARTLTERWGQHPGVQGKLAGLAADYAGWREHPRELGIFLALTMIEGLYPIAGYWAAAWALGIDATLVQMAIAVPLAFLIARLPIPAFSFGPEQGTFVVVAVQLGIASDAALAISLLFLGTLLLAFSPGALVWMSEGRD